MAAIPSPLHPLLAIVVVAAADLLQDICVADLTSSE
jgi:hypothetical protein